MDPRISLITLGVTDIGRATEFYRRLGWTPSAPSNDAVTFFQAGGMIFALYGQDAQARDAGLPSDRSDPQTPSARVALAQNQHSKGEVDAVIEAARAAGAPYVKPAEDTFWGGYSGYFADPDGHLWEIAWNPGFPLGADGTIRLPDTPD